MRLIDADELTLTLVNTVSDARHEVYEKGAHTFKETLDRLAQRDHEIIDMIVEAPTINPEDCRPHGRWVHDHYENCTEQFEIVKCSNCGYTAYAMAVFVKGGNYCPHCGAKMDGKEQGDELP